ncbi:MAG: hypothetical protein Q8L22_15355 [Reyranella sp.]|nr:hypothetical protein [Reyranella sp.]
MTSALAAIGSLQVEVITDNMSDTYASRPSFAVSELANVMLAGAKEISGETLLVTNLGYGLRLRTRRGATEHTLLFDTGTEGAVFLRNCRNLGIDLLEVEEIAVAAAASRSTSIPTCSTSAVCSCRTARSSPPPAFLHPRKWRRAVRTSSTTAGRAPSWMATSTTAARSRASRRSRLVARTIFADVTIRRTGDLIPT